MAYDVDDKILYPLILSPRFNKRNMIKGKTLRHTLDKFLKNSEVSKEARVQVCLPNGEFYDITGIQLMENKLIGNRESHRLIITIDKERWTMGQVIRKV